MGLRKLLRLLVLLPTLLIAALLSSYFIHMQMANLQHQALMGGEHRLNELMPALEYGLQHKDTQYLQTVAEQLVMHDAQITSLQIYNAKGERITSAGDLQAFSPPANTAFNKITEVKTLLTHQKGDALHLIAAIHWRPLVDKNHYPNLLLPWSQPGDNKRERIGWVRLTVSLTMLKAAADQDIAVIVLITLLALLVSLLIGWWLSTLLTRPITSMATVVSKIGSGNLDARVKDTVHDELFVLKHGINDMAARLAELHGDMEKKVTSATAELEATLQKLSVQNEALIFARQDALAASKAKSAFLANMSHEIRTPLNAILGFVELLQEQQHDEQKEYLQTVHESAKHLLHVINDILDYSKIEAQKLTVEITPTDLRSTTYQVTQLLGPSARQKGLELSTLIYADVPAMVEIDVTRYKQILTNLIGNAIKFTLEGHVIVRIMLDEANETQTDVNYPEQNDKCTLKVEITDTGIGLSRQEQTRLFEAFSQGDTSTTRKFGGTGLGLVIVKRLVEAFGGDVDLRSVKNHGTTFSFTIQTNRLDIDTPPLPNLPQTKISLHEPFSTTRMAKLQAFELAQAEVTIVKDLNECKIQDSDLIVLGSKTQAETEAHLNWAIKHKDSRIVLLTVANIDTTVLAKHTHIWHRYKPITDEKLLEVCIKALKNEADHTVESATKTHNSSDRLTAIPNDEQKEAILVVDDNPANRRLLEIMLQQLNFAVDTAANGKQAVELATQNETTYKAIFMDLQMPEMDGTTACGIINLHLTKEQCITPIIALTADVVSVDKDVLFAAGFSAVLAKPISKTTLQQLLITERKSNSPSFSSEVTTAALNTQPDSIDDDIQDNRAMSDEIVALFKKTLPEDIAQIEKALDNNDLTQLTAAVHRFHGSCCYVDMPKLKQTAHKTEHLLKQASAISDTERQAVAQLCKLAKSKMTHFSSS